MHSSRMRTARSLPYGGFCLVVSVWGLSLTETTLDRDHPGQRPPGQRPPGQRPPLTEIPLLDRDLLDRDPSRQRPPGQRPLDRDPLWTETPCGQRPSQTETTPQTDSTTPDRD